MKITTVSTTFVPKIGYQCQIATDDGRSITFRDLGNNGIRWVARVGYWVREEFLFLHQRASQEIFSLRRQSR